MKRSKTEIKVWGIFENGKPKFPPYVDARVQLFAQDKKDVLFTMTAEQKCKSLDFLGWFWGALLPAYVAHNKFNLTQAQLDLDPMLLSELCKQKKITAQDTREAERMFLREFAPVYIKDLKSGKMEREGGRLSSMGSQTAMQFATLVYDYMQKNGYPIPDAEKYKLERDKAELIIQKGISPADIF